MVINFIYDALIMDSKWVSLPVRLETVCKPRFFEEDGRRVPITTNIELFRMRGVAVPEDSIMCRRVKRGDHPWVLGQSASIEGPALCCKRPLVSGGWGMAGCDQQVMWIHRRPMEVHKPPYEFMAIKYIKQALNSHIAFLPSEVTLIPV